MGRTGNAKKPQRDVTKLSGKPLSETLEPSTVLSTPSEPWVTSRDLTESGLPFILEAVQQMVLYLLANPNKGSTLLFRADILFDSEGLLSTPREKERDAAGAVTVEEEEEEDDDVDPRPAREVAGFVLTRTVVRRLVPRNVQIDRPVEQTCCFYVPGGDTAADSSCRRLLVVYTPHVTSKEDIPFYHPRLRSLALLYDFYPSPKGPVEAGAGSGVLSLHFLPFPDEPIQTRLERTLKMLMEVQIRLTRATRLTETLEPANHNPTKDNVLPQHLVQNTYSRLKAKYAVDLCNRWVEQTEPTKHVFEDLAVAAFLIELWRSMYTGTPTDERQTNDDAATAETFPGFVDMACGNGVLVYILLQEGYHGWGFDARRRKTWSIFPDSVRVRLREEIYIPQPFAEELSTHPEAQVFNDNDFNLGVKTHSGSSSFPRDTFIISNHADELTLWTPIIAALLNPASPSPFLAIPCCSHSLSGARYRYSPPPPLPQTPNKDSTPSTPLESIDSAEKREPTTQGQEHPESDQPATGDLKALRRTKQSATQADTPAFMKSTYGALTAKTVAVAEEIGYEVEKTLLRIPSTRNMGVLGGRRRAMRAWALRGEGSLSGNDSSSGGGDGASEIEDRGERVLGMIGEVVRRECVRDGGVYLAARGWVERAKGLHSGKGYGGGHRAELKEI